MKWLMMGVAVGSLAFTYSAVADLVLEIDPATGVVRMATGPSETITIDGFTINENSFASVWRPENLDLSGLPTLSDGGSVPQGIAALGGVSGGAPVGEAGVSIGAVFDPIAGAGLTAADIYWEYSVLGGGVIQDAPVVFSVIPEPASMGLLGGLACITLLRRRSAA